MTRIVNLVVLFLLALFVAPLSAENKWVGPGGNNANSGNTRFQRWRDFSYAIKNLTPGDTLTVLDGYYDIRQEDSQSSGLAFVRSAAFGRLDGWTNAITTIRAENSRGATIRGNLDILGSFITIEGFRILGDPQGVEPGIIVRDGHHIDILDNEVAFAGGGGINFNHSDTFRIVGNTVHNCCFRNPQQHSGISVYQPIAQVDPENRYWKIEIRRNVCYQNLCYTPGGLGQTDGNGIIVDDYRYTQNVFLEDYHYDMIGDLDEYPGRTLIEANLSTFNGGAGIRLFQATRVVVKNNTCVSNNLLLYYNDTPAGPLFYNAGQILLGDSFFCHILNNICQSHYVRDAPDGSPYAASDEFGYGNLWECNMLHSKVTMRGLWDNPVIGNKAKYWNPGWNDEANYDFRARNGYNQGIRWTGHVYEDLFGKIVQPGGRIDMGAIQN